MVTYSAHGTNCCGAASLRGFGTAEENNVDLIDNVLRDNVAVGRLVDITLNANQVARPRTMQRLADLGFVLDAHWINSVHGSDVYRFTRCDSRRGLLAGPIAGRWNGMVMTAGLTGDLPAVPGQGRGAGAVDYTPYIRDLPANAERDAHTRAAAIRDRIGGGGGRPARANNYAGARFRINSPRSRHHGRELVCIERTWDGYLNFGDGIRIVQANCVRIEAPAAAPAVNEATRDFRVGERIQIARTWGPQFPVGLVGTLTAVSAHNGVVTIRFDDPRPGLETSNPEYIHLVDYARQPDFPRERIVAPAVPAVPPARVAQRHEDAVVALGAAERPAPPAVRVDGEIVVGSRVRRINGPNGGVVAGTLGTVWQIAGRRIRVDWDGLDQRANAHFRENLELVVDAVPAPVAPPAPAPVPVIRVAQYFHCVFADGRRGAGYQTIEEARRNLGRRRRIDSFDVMSNGNNRWVENVQ